VERTKFLSDSGKRNQLSGINAKLVSAKDSERVRALEFYFP
jgi:hypothetical protein